jgi:hypothetical protein
MQSAVHPVAAQPVEPPVAKPAPLPVRASARNVAAPVPAVRRTPPAAASRGGDEWEEF